MTPLELRSAEEKIVAVSQQQPTLIQVVPRRGLEPNGVADYALALARQLRSCSGFTSVFLSTSPPAQAMPIQDEWKTVFLPRRQAQCIAETIRSLAAGQKALAVLLHFSGYGYQKRGVPLWLVHGLRLSHANHLPLVTIFHELYATGQPWQSSFWLSPLQKQIARSIMNLSSAAITPTELYSKRLSALRDDSGIKIMAMPVFSNMGEPGCGPAPYARGASAIVFGLAGVEDRLFGLYLSQIERIIAALGIEKIFDIGPRLFPMPKTLAGAAVISKGVLPQRTVSELLQNARFGFVAYPLDFIGKSGVFAAYASHGVVPIVLSETYGTYDGLQPSQHFLDGLRFRMGVGGEDLALIQHRLFTWYTSHSVKIQAELLLNLISRAVRPSTIGIA